MSGRWSWTDEEPPETLTPEVPEAVGQIGGEEDLSYLDAEEQRLRREVEEAQARLERRIQANRAARQRAAILAASAPRPAVTSAEVEELALQLAAATAKGAVSRHLAVRAREAAALTRSEDHQATEQDATADPVECSQDRATPAREEGADEGAALPSQELQAGAPRSASPASCESPAADQASALPGEGPALDELPLSDPGKGLTPSPGPTSPARGTTPSRVHRESPEPSQPEAADPLPSVNARRQFPSTPMEEARERRRIPLLGILPSTVAEPSPDTETSAPAGAVGEATTEEGPCDLPSSPAQVADGPSPRPTVQVGPVPASPLRRPHVRTQYVSLGPARPAARTVPPPPPIRRTPTGEETWDDDPAPAPAVAGVTESAGSTRPGGKKSKKYNPRRHLELDDLESVVERPRSPSPPLVPVPDRGSVQRARSPWRPRSEADQTARPATQDSTKPPPDRARSRSRSGTRDGPSRRPSASRPAVDYWAPEDYPARTTGVMFGGLKVIPTDPRIDPPPHVCINCWERGHIRMACPKPRRNDICVNCGRRGVRVHQCPRCSDAQLRHNIERRSRAHRLEAEQSRSTSTAAGPANPASPRPQTSTRRSDPGQRDRGDAMVTSRVNEPSESRRADDEWCPPIQFGRGRPLASRLTAAGRRPAETTTEEAATAIGVQPVPSAPPASRENRPSAPAPTAAAQPLAAPVPATVTSIEPNLLEYTLALTQGLSALTPARQDEIYAEIFQQIRARREQGQLIQGFSALTPARQDEIYEEIIQRIRARREQGQPPQDL